jgi:pSer/pThr/pTyr-binding forkhead associated (FHA) protein
MNRCPRCRKENALGAPLCRWCRARLDGAPVIPAPKLFPEARADEVPGMEQLRSVVQRLVADRLEEPNRPLRAPPRAAEIVETAAPVQAAASPAVSVTMEHRAFRLVVLNNDGSDGVIHRLTNEQVDIGRAEGDLTFDDPYLAPRHARIARTAGGFTLRDLETTNGIFRRLRSRTALTSGDLILIGRQMLQFDEVSASENDMRPAIADGVTLWGTPVRAAWGRLRRLASTGLIQDVYHLSRDEVMLGREFGDIVISDDEFMSRRHARFSSLDGGHTIEDLATANGTFLRVRGHYALADRDQIRMGNVLLRFEL